MKNRRQSKLAKAAKKKAVVSNDATDKTNKTYNLNKDLITKKTQKVAWEDLKTTKPKDSDTKKAKLEGIAKTANITSESASNKKGTKTEVKHYTFTPQITSISKPKSKNEINDLGGEKAIDVQTYLRTLPSEEIRKFIEGLIAEDKFNMLPVNTSAIIGNMTKMEEYFKKNPHTGKSKYDPNGRCLDGGTPLHAAIKAKNKASVKLLLENGADCSLVDFMGDNAIMAAIKAGDATVINTLWPYRGNLNVDHSNMLGMTALHLAAERSWEACTNFLLQNKASPNINTGTGVTPLMIAASKGDLKVVECLVKAGADVCAEDCEYNTSITRAYIEKHEKVVDFLFKQVDGENYLTFTRDLVENIMHPPLPDKDYSLMETRYLPLLIEATNYTGFRNAFYNVNVVQKVTSLLHERMRDIQVSILLSGLILSTFFKFGDEIDKYFVKQFMRSKGPDLIVQMVHFYTNDWKISEKDSIYVFLPMIGLVELPEGRAWLSRNVLAISEYFNVFDKDQIKFCMSQGEKFKWCLKTKLFQEVNRVWLAFYNEIQREQTLQRERHMTELLAQEDRERNKTRRKLEKINQKQEKEAEVSLIELWTEPSETELKQDGESSNLNANSCRAGLNDWDYIAKGGKQNDDVAYKVTKSPTKHVPSFDEIVSVLGTGKDESWTKVSSKKNKEKHNTNSRKKTEGKAKSIPIEQFTQHTPKNFTGTARWADVAKGIKKTPVSPNPLPTPVAKIQTAHTTAKFEKTDFPSLGGNNDGINKQEKPKTMVFHFHGSETPEITDYDEEVFTDNGIEDAEEIERELDAALEFEVDESKSHEYVLDTEIDCKHFHAAYDEALIGDIDSESVEYYTDGVECETDDVYGTTSQTEDDSELVHNTEYSEVKLEEDLIDLHVDENSTNHTGQNIIYHSQTDMKSEITTQSQKVTKTMSEHSKKSAVASVKDVKIDMRQIEDCEVNNDSVLNESNLPNESIDEQIQYLLSSGILNNKEAKMYKKQIKAFEIFKDVLGEIESDPFMELSEALAYLRKEEAEAEKDDEEEENSFIDDMFDSPGHIPENIEDDIQNPCSQEQNKAPLDGRHSNIIISGNFVQVQPSYGYHKLMENCPNPHKGKTHESPLRDLVASDPAIIHCVNNKLVSTPRLGNVDTQSSVVQQNMPQKAEERKKSYVEKLLENNVTCKKDLAHGDDGELDLESIRKQTAIITPLKKLDGSSYPSVNCELGNNILSSACQLERQEEDDIVENIGVLNGESIEPDTRNIDADKRDDDQFFFPNFHSDTKLSSHYNTANISVPHRMQQIQHQNLHNYYVNKKEQICNANSWEQDKFTYMAQAAGMDKELINRHLDGQMDMSKPMPMPSYANSAPVNMNEQMKRQSRPNGGPQQVGFGYPNPGVPMPAYVPVQIPVANGKHFVPLQQPPLVGMLPASPMALLMPYQIPKTMCEPPLTHPANIRNIQAQQAEMSKTVKNKIAEILSTMFKAKMKSVRWRAELDKMRTLPPEKLQMIGNILVPKNENDRQYVAFHSTGNTILGYLLDGSEVAVKITNSLYRPFKSEDVNRLMSMETAHHQFVNKYKAIEVQDNLFYIASDLFEYTLPEYLNILKKQALNNLNLVYVKMVFQLLRGISTLHQQYLIVHAELRPENILIDLDGNIKIGGYGFGRNVDRDTQFVDYNDDDKCWLAPEVLFHRQRVSFKSDIWTTGMLIYYIFKGGENPFGTKPRDIINNMGDQSYKIQKVGEESYHLIGTMLSLNRTERPAVSDALKHPLFWADEKRMRFINIVGSDVVRELKGSNLDSCGNAMINVLTRITSSLEFARWMTMIDPLVLREMRSFRHYKNNFIDLIVFVFNCCNHFDTLTSRTREIVDEPCHYFLTKFPSLLMTVHRAIKASDKKDKPCYKPFF